MEFLWDLTQLVFWFSLFFFLMGLAFYVILFVIAVIAAAVGGGFKAVREHSRARRVEEASWSGQTVTVELPVEEAESFLRNDYYEGISEKVADAVKAKK